MERTFKKNPSHFTLGYCLIFKANILETARKLQSNELLEWYALQPISAQQAKLFLYLVACPSLSGKNPTTLPSSINTYWLTGSSNSSMYVCDD